MESGTRSSSRHFQFDSFTEFFGELGRRRVWRTVLTYAAVVFVLLQLGEIVFPAFEAPDWALRLLVVACFLGLPLVLALAWAFDITPEGIQRALPDDDTDRGHGYTGTTLPRLALLSVTLATVLGVGWWTVQDTLEAQAAGPGTPPNGVAATSVSLDDAALQVRSLAVLPLQDFSEEEGGEYFTAGFHEELVSQLSQIASARVLSRTSMVQYDATGKTMPTIAAELGVEGVVEGSVFRDGNRVRITVQLIHGATDRHLWANSYDGTLEDAIGLQRTVAQAIAREIQAELFPEERWTTPETRVASSPQVQQEYLKGRYAQAQATPESLETAIDHFQEALREDSTFAPAYAGLAGARLLLSVQRSDSAISVSAADNTILTPLSRALTLDGESPEAQAVLFSLRESLGGLPEEEWPAGFEVVVDSLSNLEGEIALSATEFGRQLQRILVHKGPGATGAPAPSPSQRLVQARRFQGAADFETAEVLIRSVIEEAPHSAEAWDALEDLQAARGDFQAVAQVREERVARSVEQAKEAVSLHDLEVRLAQDPEHGYWSWQMQELEDRQAQGEPISPVLMARAYVGAHQTERALQELEKALSEKDRNLATLWTDPVWDSIRADPRFRKILAGARGTGKEDVPPPGNRF